MWLNHGIFIAEHVGWMSETRIVYRILMGKRFLEGAGTTVLTLILKTVLWGCQLD
jgi:hypothetical protein